MRKEELEKIYKKLSAFYKHYKNLIEKQRNYNANRVVGEPLMPIDEKYYAEFFKNIENILKIYDLRIKSIYKDSEDEARGKILNQISSLEQIGHDVAYSAPIDGTKSQILIDDDGIPRRYRLQVFHIDGIVCTILVGIELENPRVHITFKGTTSLNCLKMDAESHPGEQTFERNKITILTKIKEIISDRYHRINACREKNDEAILIIVTVTGHSLGATLAEFATLELVRAQVSNDKKCEKMLLANNEGRTSLSEDTSSFINYVDKISLGTCNSPGVSNEMCEEFKMLMLLLSQYGSAPIKLKERFDITSLGDPVQQGGQGHLGYDKKLVGIMNITNCKVDAGASSGIFAIVESAIKAHKNVFLIPKSNGNTNSEQSLSFVIYTNKNEKECGKLIEETIDTKSRIIHSSLGDAGKVGARFCIHGIQCGISAAEGTKEVIVNSLPETSSMFSLLSMGTALLSIGTEKNANEDIESIELEQYKSKSSKSKATEDNEAIEIENIEFEQYESKNIVFNNKDNKKKVEDNKKKVEDWVVIKKGTKKATENSFSLPSKSNVKSAAKSATSSMLSWLSIGTTGKNASSKSKATEESIARSHHESKNIVFNNKDNKKKVENEWVVIKGRGAALKSNESNVEAQMIRSKL